MVKFISTIFLFASIAVSIFASPLEQRDVAQVRGDLKEASRIVSKLDADVMTIGDKINIQQALTIRAGVADLHKAIDQTTRDVKNVHSVSDAEGREILGEVQAFAPVIMHLLETTCQKKRAFLSFSSIVLAFIKSEFASLHTSANVLGDALIGVAPNIVKPEALGLKNSINAAFIKVIECYN